ncbi:Uncharacterized protein dnl_40520 [Desulfonema limicola]|uniref:Uncharacterized protein n=1 Tax=Desulfonema limicola TaxID=45656 RepID=A0A975B9Z5_9BACT|nr:Uncharacterized protein dnl_40520 [Desulfonema limicola]
MIIVKSIIKLSLLSCQRKSVIMIKGAGWNNEKINPKGLKDP